LASKLVYFNHPGADHASGLSIPRSSQRWRQDDRAQDDQQDGEDW
jgi:hypothetical protein